MVRESRLSCLQYMVLKSAAEILNGLRVTSLRRDTRSMTAWCLPYLSALESKSSDTTSSAMSGRVELLARVVPHSLW